MPPLDFSAHEALARARASPDSRFQDATVIAGYLGGSVDGRVHLHASLEHLDEFLEIPESAVVHLADAPADVLPGGAKLLWVRRDAQVRYTRVTVAEIEARYLAGPIEQAHLGPAAEGGHEMRQPFITPTTATLFHYRSIFCVRDRVRTGPGGTELR